jgi:flavin-dependent dehydrogenase
MIGGAREVTTTYGQPVSFGIRRCEFDDYLLRRAAVRTALGTPVSSLRRTGTAWIVNEAIRTPLLVGAGGQFCPVARRLNEALPSVPLVVAQEAEFRIEPAEAAGFPTTAEGPELFFSDDFKGYGWCFRKQDHLNIGLGRIGSRSLPAATAGFLAFLQARRKVPAGLAPRMRGHAYQVFGGGLRRLTDDGVVLVGDAAGLAYPQSGEGIRPAIESALLAAEVIADANGRYSCDTLERYSERLHGRFGEGALSRVLSRVLPGGIASWLGRALISHPSFVEHVALNRWFLHRGEPAL